MVIPIALRKLKGFFPHSLDPGKMDQFAQAGMIQLDGEMSLLQA